MSPDLPCSAGPILVAVGSDVRALRLVHAGFRTAREQGRPWLAVHVELLGRETAEEADQARVWLQEARELGAEVVWIQSSSLVNGLLAELCRSSAASLLMGQSGGTGLLARMGSARTQDLLKRYTEIRISVVPLDTPFPDAGSVRSLPDGLGILAATAILLLICAIFATALAPLAGFPAIPAVFAAGTAFTAHRWGRRAALLALLLSTMLYLALFAEPRFSLAAADWPRLLSFLGTLGAAQVMVDLADRLRNASRTVRRREAETVLLMLLGRALARCTTLDEVAEVLSQRIHRIFQAEAWLLVPGQDDAWIRPGSSGGFPDCPAPSTLLPECADASQRRDPLEPLFEDGCSYVPLAGPKDVEGVLQIRLPSLAGFPQRSWGSLQAFAVQGALAIERIRSLEAARQAHVDRETERMRSTLLSAISHDLRTPLAAIQGAASSLLLPVEPMPEATRRDMLAMIHDESRQLALLLSNLLDLTRLESGVIRASKEWQPLDEVVGAVLRRLDTGGQAMKVQVGLPADLPLVPLDAALTEQLLANLLLNARRHAPASPVELRAWTGSGTLELSVCDHGPGIPEDFRSRIFDKFFRMPGNTRDGGAGLGLAICDSIVKAQDGRLWVEDTPGGGATFRVSLPRDGDPPALPQEI